MSIPTCVAITADNGDMIPRVLIASITLKVGWIFLEGCQGTQLVFRVH